MIIFLTRLFREETGVTMIEYALIAALIAVVAISMVILVGDWVNNAFNAVASALENSLD